MKQRIKEYAKNVGMAVLLIGGLYILFTLLIVAFL